MCAYVDPDLRFLSGTQEVLSREDGEAWLGGLITDTLARLKDRGLPTSSAAIRWERVQSSRRSRERHFCEAAGSLSLDPYNIVDKLAGFIESAESVFDDEPLIEFVSDAGNVDQTRLIGWVERMMRIKGHQYRLAELRPIVDQLVRNAQPSVNGQAWAMGYRRARAMRRALNLRCRRSAPASLRPSSTNGRAWTSAPFPACPPKRSSPPACRVLRLARSSALQALSGLTYSTPCLMPNSRRSTPNCHGLQTAIVRPERRGGKCETRVKRLDAVPDRSPLSTAIENAGAVLIGIAKQDRERLLAGIYTARKSAKR